MPSIVPEGFRWTEEPWGMGLRCQALEVIADHVFTTRELQLGSSGLADDGWRAVSDAVSVGRDALRRVVQVHGTAAAIYRRSTGVASRAQSRVEADMLATDDSAIALAVQTADCVPVLLADRRGRAVLAAHAGWRGTALGIARRAVGVLAHEFGARPEDLVAAVGPSIGPCCYQVGTEVREAFLQAGHAVDQVNRWFSSHTTPPIGVRFDLWRATADQLIDAGIDPAQIHVAGLCTATHADLFYSYRRDGAGTGRMAAVIRGRTKN